MQNKKMLPLTDRRALVVYLQEMRYRRIAFQNFRWAYNMDGIDDRWTLDSRAINPDGDIDIEFMTGPVTPAAGGVEYAVLSQCLTSVFANKEFNLYFNSAMGALQMQVGGAYSASTALVVLSSQTKYRALLEGSRLRFFRNDQQMLDSTFNRGSAREPSAKTVIGASTHGSENTFRAFARGIFYNIKINGTLWPMADRNQSIQPSIPAGNNMTGANLNPDRWVEIPK